MSILSQARWHLLTTYDIHRIVELKLAMIDRDHKQAEASEKDLASIGTADAPTLPPPPPPLPSPDADPSEMLRRMKLMNIDDFPDPSLWDSAWLQRFSDITAKELVVLHAQMVRSHLHINIAKL